MNLDTNPIISDPVRQRQRRERAAKWRVDKLPTLRQSLQKRLNHGHPDHGSDGAKRPATASPSTTASPRAVASGPTPTTTTDLIAPNHGGGDAMTVDAAPPASVMDMDVDAADVDPLDQFMVDVTTQVAKIHAADLQRLTELKGTNSVEALNAADDGDAADAEHDILALAAKKLGKKKDIAAVDHKSIAYEPFRKNFYIEPPELAALTVDEVKDMRAELDGIKVAGKECPKPAMKWTHCGLPAACYKVIKDQCFTAPTPIQAQAIPAIMAGRDVIGVAKTGSGKTLAFLLPLLRHIKDQREVQTGEGPIALIMTPTRELAMQIHKEAKLFGKPLNIRSACCYGGSPISDQIADLKRGAEIVVCTPGRMIDLLCANAGRVTNLLRVTYLVLDEADRMFDMGFEPQVMKIVNNVRPDRQTVLFSATFPRAMESLARKILKRPLEITVGGKSVVATDVTQVVEVIKDADKFLRLLEVLGKWFAEAAETDIAEPRVLIFVDRQEAADQLMNTLLKRGYVCNALHGGKDQADRDSTIADFKAGVFPILIATSVAARGLDVKGLNLVINFDCPNHKEDYVHRVGRTGRAGNKGTAVTFITPEQERYAGDLVYALTASNGTVPPDLQAMADGFKEKVKAGQAQRASSGFGGKGLEKLDKERDLIKQAQKASHGIVDEEAGGSDNDEEKDEKVAGLLEKIALPPTIKKNAPVAAGAASTTLAATSTEAKPAGVARALDVLNQLNQQLRSAAPSAPAAASTPAAPSTETRAGRGVVNFTCEFEINDFPQRARWKVTNKDQINQISDLSGAAITTRGEFFPEGKQPKGAERKLYLFIEGETELAVDRAKNEIRRILLEAVVATAEIDAKSSGTTGRYSVV
ncbi:hypothetical protein AMAG_07028 [Allomyces macrogynus ATCC 38327]|uniref:RNA helicase n=1 Tax=Allomyces macrogynus (strain ATCC 38327) TaxID=578462 RepID=A0A0L0SFQ7_ALLM3|nr:hypothetical protein AMAG_07028 [Allomyces macrogynus ATCC 38327]|eukprot:KNE61287.1 hypothetical protein AMAG_07028 [Allomyces macrogynus ATCC 38327]